MEITPQHLRFATTLDIQIGVFYGCLQCHRIYILQWHTICGIKLKELICEQYLLILYAFTVVLSGICQYWVRGHLGNSKSTPGIWIICQIPHHGTIHIDPDVIQKVVPLSNAVKIIIILGINFWSTPWDNTVHGTLPTLSLPPFTGAINDNCIIYFAWKVIF